MIHVSWYHYQFSQTNAICLPVCHYAGHTPGLCSGYQWHEGVGWRGSQQRGLKHPWGTSLQSWSGVFPRCHSSLLFIFAQSIGTKTEGPLPPCAKCIKPNYLANSSDVLNTWDVLLYILYETYTPDAQQFVCPLKYFVSLVVKLIITILASVGWKNLDLIDHYSFISLSSPEH